MTSFIAANSIDVNFCAHNHMKSHTTLSNAFIEFYREKKNWIITANIVERWIAILPSSLISLGWLSSKRCHCWHLHSYEIRYNRIYESMHVPDRNKGVAYSAHMSTLPKGNKEIQTKWRLRRWSLLWNVYRISNSILFGKQFHCNKLKSCL